MNYLNSLILGIVQGLTEFLPVSSSGHLLIFENFMQFGTNAEKITFAVILHLATLLAVIWVYRGDLKSIFISGTVGGEDDSPGIPKWRLIGFLAISVGVTGFALLFNDRVEALFENINGVRIFLLINAVALAVLPMLRKGSIGLDKMPWWGAVVIGVAQLAGVFPGISRSGSTILAGLLLGLKPRDACRYSFLLSIPTILVAGLKQILDAMQEGLVFSAGPVILGFVMALAAGLVAIPLLIGVVEKGKLWGFAIYCAVLGVALFFIIPAA